MTYGVSAKAGDNLWMHYAFVVAQPGGAPVVSTGSAVGFDYPGEVVGRLGFPTLAACASIRRTGRDPSRDGSVGQPIRIGDVTMRPGALVFGAADGVVVASNQVNEAAARARRGEAVEDLIMAPIANAFAAAVLTPDLLGLCQLGTPQ